MILKTYNIQVLPDLEAKELFQKAQKVVKCNLKGVKIDEDRTLMLKTSTDTPDRSKDVVCPDGVVLNNHKENPAVAAFHKYDQPAVR
jgi:hypothetical protein